MVRNSRGLCLKQSGMQEPTPVGLLFPPHTSHTHMSPYIHTYTNVHTHTHCTHKHKGYVYQHSLKPTWPFLKSSLSLKESLERFLDQTCISQMLVGQFTNICNFNSRRCVASAGITHTHTHTHIVHLHTFSKDTNTNNIKIKINLKKLFINQSINTTNER